MHFIENRLFLVVDAVGLTLFLAYGAFRNNWREIMLFLLCLTILVMMIVSFVYYCKGKCAEFEEKRVKPLPYQKGFADGFIRHKNNRNEMDFSAQMKDGDIKKFGMDYIKGFKDGFNERLPASPDKSDREHGGKHGRA